MKDYPSEQALRFIRHYDILTSPIEDLRDFIIQDWHWPDWGTKVRGRKFELHTGGWSGNESIIMALEQTGRGLFWGMCWVMSKRGGHYWFEIPQRMTRRYLKKYLAEKKAEEPRDGKA
jgi:hypothetical protein